MSIYEEIKQFQFNIDAIIAERLQEFEFIGRYLSASQGKRLRSKIYWLACKILNENPSAKIAAAFEMLHQATLMHDDVLDNANIRRNIKTLSAEKGSNFSILAGDILLSSCMRLIAEERSFPLIDLFSELAFNLIQGELKCQNMSLSSSIDEYKQNAYLKTGCFFESIIRSVKSQDNPLIEFGHEFGIFFQMADDYKDYFCTATTTGKKQFQDLMSRTVTFPIIVAYEHADEKERRKIREFFEGNGEMANVVATANRNKEKILETLRTQKSMVITSLEQVEGSSHKEKLSRLIDLTY
ncbi:MAG: polyprenyl synthetase family protein [Alphaproteobacteria bacterium]|nr:polyprenyl synthetase family protein [Alphaproteobacteria bacterium]